MESSLLVDSLTHLILRDSEPLKSFIQMDQLFKVKLVFKDINIIKLNKIQDKISVNHCHKRVQRSAFESFLVC